MENRQMDPDSQTFHGSISVAIVVLFSLCVRSVMFSHYCVIGVPLFLSLTRRVWVFPHVMATRFLV